METMPFTRQKELFTRLSKVTSYANLSPTEKRRYDADLKAYRDLTNQMDYAKSEATAQGLAEGRAQGLAEGRAEGRAEGENAEKIRIVKHMKMKGFDTATIAAIVDKPQEWVESINA